MSIADYGSNSGVIDARMTTLWKKSRWTSARRIRSWLLDRELISREPRWPRRTSAVLPNGHLFSEAKNLRRSDLSEVLSSERVLLSQHDDDFWSRGVNKDCTDISSLFLFILTNSRGKRYEMWQKRRKIQNHKRNVDLTWYPWISRIVRLWSNEWRWNAS